MDTADFRALYDYNAWANRRTLDACLALSPEQFLQDMKSSFASVRDTLAHLYGAEYVWFERWSGRTPQSFPAAVDFPDFNSIYTRLTELDAALIAFVGGLDEAKLSRVLEYKLLSGKAQSGPLVPMLQHAVNHSTYHRGQITTLLRQLGAKGTSTDLIAYYREIAATKATA
jgi:uncharacterized damage-inducible protein DinB